MPRKMYIKRPKGRVVAASFDESLKGEFHITKPTIILFFEEQRHVAHTLPAGSIVTALDGHVGDEGLLDITWDGRKGLMFAIDLKSRGMKIEAEKLEH